MGSRQPGPTGAALAQLLSPFPARDFLARHGRPARRAQRRPRSCDQHEPLSHARRRAGVPGPHGRPRGLCPAARRAEALGVYKPNYRLPLESRLTDGELGKAVLSPELEAGDLLYIPRGFIHRAHTTDASSLHLTIGVQSWRWVDVLHRAVDAWAEQDPALRRTVPPAAASAALARQVRSLLGRMATAADIDAAAVAAYRKEMAKQSVPVPGSRFAAIDRLGQVDGRTVVRHRSGIRCSLSRDKQTSVLHFGDRSLELPTAVASTLEFVAGHRSFCADSLPGRLSGDAKLKLVRRLLRDGFLVIDDDKGSGGP